MRYSTRLKVAILHGMLGAGNGGSEACAMWAAQALKTDFAVSLVSAGPVDLAQLNLFYGTALDPRDINIRTLPIPRLLAKNYAPSALRGAFVSRALKSIAREHEILISTYNCADFGMPAIQRIADFSWDEDVRRRFDPTPSGVYGVFHRVRWLRSLYLRACGFVAQPSGRTPLSADDLIVANSRWTAAKLYERYGTLARVIYPPVAGEMTAVPFEDRKDDFVCVGRISSEKRIERMIRIVASVRRRGHDVRIRIVGHLDTSQYSRSIIALARRHRDWICLEGRKVGTEKVRLLSTCRYGIHAREGEAFGISVAEMIKAGCIAFAPAEGGPAEILNHEALLFRDDEDAVERIIEVLNRPKLRRELVGHLRRQSEQFSADSFMAGIREVVNDFVCQAPSASIGLLRKDRAKAC
jgi:glycosyltransferase involved in cell wall biosynthesis